jgi:ADP-ribose pyrophosphatase YjhB (NUDIX family)
LTVRCARRNGLAAHEAPRIRLRHATEEARRQWSVIFCENELLIVKPTYREKWLIPGGVVELGESPRDACLREVREELGLELQLERLLTVEYNRTENGESLQFIFAVEKISRAALKEIRLPADEIAEFKLVAPADAVPMLEPYLSRRVRHALEAIQNGEGPIYLECGAKIG